MDSTHFQDFFSTLTDDELLTRVRNGLIPEAQAVAAQELARRGIPLPADDANADADANNIDPDGQMPWAGDLVLLMQDLSPTDAHLLTACLAAAGIQAVAGDTDTVRNNDLWSIALGGAKIRVPTSQLDEARQVLQAFHAGELSLDDDFDVGPSAPE